MQGGGAGQPPHAVPCITNLRCRQRCAHPGVGLGLGKSRPIGTRWGRRRERRGRTCYQFAEAWYHSFVR
jgi:hypothetical protein